MSARSDAEAHVGKAQEFLAAARNDLEYELLNAATSSAVIAGINAKDTICLILTGRTAKADNHQEAVAELKAAGKVGAQLAPTLGRLLRLKSKSQYQASAISASDADKAAEWAQRMVDTAVLVLRS